MPLGRRLRYGMIGGGPGAFIGAVHRKAIALDDSAELVAGAFSADAEKSRQQGEELFLDPSRVYGSYLAMAEKEAARPDDERMDFVSIVTPNYLHYPIAKTFIEAGFHIVCDKPITTTVEDAELLCRMAKQHDVVFALTHNYSGYPMVKEARDLVRQGELGTVMKVVSEYSQGWLARLIEAEGAKQAVWRTDPAQTGVSSAIGDIGSHAHHLARYITGLELEAMCADLSTFVAGRELEDDGNILVKFQGGAGGIIYASQMSVGEENGIRIHVYGSDASLVWRQENPNYLHVLYPDGPEKIYKRGNDYLSPIAQHNTRLPSGHPEAFFEAFANIYVNTTRTISAKIAGEQPGEFDTDFPTAQDGARGVHFIHTAVKSGKSHQKWIDARYTPPE